MRLHMVVQRVADFSGGVLGGQRQQGHLAVGVHAGVGAAGGNAGDRLIAVQLGGGGFEDGLDGQADPLSLPADEGGAVVLDQQRPVPGHSRTVPGGIGRPRSRASASIA